MTGSPTWLNVLIVIGAAAVAIMLGYGLWWSWFSDRARGRRRCPSCWYDMSRTSGLQCNECGQVAGNERDLMRARRRPLVAVTCIIGLSVLGAATIDQWRSSQWTSYVPSSAILLALPILDGNGDLVQELHRRMDRDKLSAEHWNDLRARVLEGDGAAAPASDAWCAKYGPIALNVQQWLNNQKDDAAIDAFEQALFELQCRRPPRFRATSRDSWPVGVSPAISVHVSDWLPGARGLRVRVDTTLPGFQPVVCTRPGAESFVRDFSLSLPPQGAGDHRVELKFSVERRRPGSTDWVAAGESMCPVSFRVDSTQAPNLIPVSDELMSESIRRIFGDGLVQWRTGSLPVRIRIDPRPTYEKTFAGVAVALHVDLVRNGRVARQLQTWWLGGLNVADRFHTHAVPMALDDLLTPESTEADEWILRVRGDESLAWRVPGAAQFWSGEISFPVKVWPQLGDPPPRIWLVEPSGSPVGDA